MISNLLLLDRVYPSFPSIFKYFSRWRKNFRKSERLEFHFQIRVINHLLGTHLKFWEVEANNCRLMRGCVDRPSMKWGKIWFRLSAASIVLTSSNTHHTSWGVHGNQTHTLPAPSLESPLPARSSGLQSPRIFIPFLDNSQTIMALTVAYY